MPKGIRPRRLFLFVLVLGACGVCAASHGGVSGVFAGPGRFKPPTARFAPNACGNPGRPAGGTGPGRRYLAACPLPVKPLAIDCSVVASKSHSLKVALCDFRREVTT